MGTSERGSLHLVREPTSSDKVKSRFQRSCSTQAAAKVDTRRHSVGGGRDASALFGKLTCRPAHTLRAFVDGGGGPGETSAALALMLCRAEQVMMCCAMIF